MATAAKATLATFPIVRNTLPSLVPNDAPAALTAFRSAIAFALLMLIVPKSRKISIMHFLYRTDCHKLINGLVVLLAVTASTCQRYVLYTIHPAS